MRLDDAPKLHYGVSMSPEKQIEGKRICSTVKKAQGGSEWEYGTFDLAELELEAQLVIEKMQSATKKKVKRACYKSMWKYNNSEQGILFDVADGSMVLEIALSDIQFCHFLASHFGKEKEEMIKLLQKMMVVGKEEIGKIVFDRELDSYEYVKDRVDELCKEKMERVMQANENLAEPRKGPVYSCPFAFSPESKQWLEAVWDEFESTYIPAFEEFDAEYDSSIIFPFLHNCHQKVKNILADSDGLLSELTYMLMYEREELKRNFQQFKKQMEEQEETT